MVLWFKLVEIRRSKKNKGDDYEEKIVLKWTGMNNDYMSIEMKFDDEMTMQETLKKLELKAVLGEQMSISIKPPVRVEKYGDKNEG